MSEPATPPWMAWMAEQDDTISAAVAREGGRLRGFIRRRVPDEGDVEDIVQEGFFELVEASRLMKPIQQVRAWRCRVARNRIADLWRRKGREPRQDRAGAASAGSAGMAGMAGMAD